MSITPTADEIKNGWDAESIEAYRRERESVSGKFGQMVVAGNVVTEYVKPRPAIQCESATKFNPHKWGR